MTSQIAETLTKTCNQAISAFTKTLQQKPLPFQFNIDCKLLNEKFHTNDIRDSIEFKQLFDQVQKIKNPVVYWFIIKTEILPQNIIDNLIDYKNKAGILARTTPAYKKEINSKSKVLYVGKVKNGFWGRLITHMGFLKGKGQTQGLQIFNWMGNLDLQLELHVLEFNSDMAEYLTPIEIEFAKLLSPILGKHK